MSDRWDIYITEQDVKEHCEQCRGFCTLKCDVVRKAYNEMLEHKKRGDNNEKR